MSGLYELRLQDILMSQRPLQRRLHLHLAELFDGEVQVIQGFLLLIRVVLKQQLGALMLLLRVNLLECFFSHKAYTGH